MTSSFWDVLLYCLYCTPKTPSSLAFCRSARKHASVKRPMWGFLAVCVAMLALAPRSNGQTIKLVQHGSTDNGASVTGSVVVTLNGVASGDLLTCSLTYGNSGGTTFSVSDNVNGPWSVANAAHYNAVIGQTTAQFYLANSKAGTTTITGKPGSADEYGAMNCQEWSGVATTSPLDQVTQQDGTTANPSSGSVTTASAGELILGDLENASGPTAGSGFSVINSTPTSWLSSEYQIQGSAGTVAANWTYAATAWTAQVATFKAAPVQSSIKLVQRGSTDNGASVTGSVVVTLNGVASGDLLTCSLTYGNAGGTTFSVSDNVNGPWSVANAAHYNAVIGQTTAQFYLANSKAGTTTITGKPGSADEYGAMNCQEWSGVATTSPLDQVTQQDGTTANPSSGSVTTASAGELILGDLENASGPTAGSGSSVINSTPTSWLSSEYQIQGSAGTVAANWTYAATAWTAQVATFKAATGGGGTPTPNIASLSPTSGTVGTAVTITGTNFGATQGTSTVTFNGTAGAPTAWNATSITVAVPSGATPGNVVVTVGGVASNGVNFTVTAVPPVISSSGTANGTAGTAFSYQITATNSPTNFGAAGLPAGLTVNTVSGLISGTPANAGTSTVTLTATNSGGTGSAPLMLSITGGSTGTLVSHTIQISNDADDGYYNNHNSSGWHSTPEFGGADLVGSWAGLTPGWVTGYRFPSVGANSGDAIQSAYLQLVSSDGFANSPACGSPPCSSSAHAFRVYGVAQDDGAAFSGRPGNTPLDVPYTSAYTDYTTTGPGDSHGGCKGQNNGQNTCTHAIDVTNIVQEITSRPGWTNTSAMRFVMVSTDSKAPNVYAGYEDYSANASKAAKLVVNPPVPTIVSSGAWGTGAHPTYPTTYSVGPFVYPDASTLLLFLGDYYNFYRQAIPQPTVSDSCGNHWYILAGPTNWAAVAYDMRSTVYYVQNPASCPAGTTITVTVSIQEPIFLHFLAVAGSDTVNAPIVSAITSPSPGTYTTSAISNSITLAKPGLLVSWIFGDSDAPHVFTPQAGFITDLNSTPNYLTTVFQNVSSPGSYQSQFSISPSSDGWQVLIIGLQAP